MSWDWDSDLQSDDLDMNLALLKSEGSGLQLEGLGLIGLSPDLRPRHLGTY
jgi:hypothetical protein